MTQFLPPNLLALFAPRDPIPYMPPADKSSWEKNLPPYHGIGQFVHLFEEPKDTPPPLRVETKSERRERKRREKQELAAYKLEQQIAIWDPQNNPSSTTDCYKTLFVARINYDTSESKLRREFESYGPIRKIVVIHNRKSGKPRGFAFIEYEHERDMHAAYKSADGKKIDGRRVLVDVERGRTVKGWLPRRLGGGLGGTRRGGPDVNTRYSGREEAGGRDRGDSRDKERSKERDRGDRDRGDRGDRDRKRSKSREKKRKSRSRSRERRRDRDRGDRDRGAERDRGDRDRGDRSSRRDRDKENAVVNLEDGAGPDQENGDGKKERKRSRSRERERDKDRERKRSRRSGSRDKSSRKSRSDRDRGDKDRDKDRRRDKDRNRDKEYRNDAGDVVIKQEPPDDDYLASLRNNEGGYEDEYEEKYKPDLGEGAGDGVEGEGKDGERGYDDGKSKKDSRSRYGGYPSADADETNERSYYRQQDRSQWDD